MTLSPPWTPRTFPQWDIFPGYDYLNVKNSLTLIATLILTLTVVFEFN